MQSGTGYTYADVYDPAANHVILWEPYNSTECDDLRFSRRDWDLVKDVDADFISAINEQSGSMFALRQIKPESASSELIAKTITGTDNGYDVSIPMTDPRGSQSYILNIRSPTTFYGLAVNTIALVAFILLVIGVLTAVVLAIFMRVAVASPLEQIIRHTDQVSKTGNLDRRLNYNRKDEIGILAQSYDGMLEQLKQARIQVQEMSYAAGISNTAADMLHNIRNSLTPISTALWKGKESLAAMKVARLSQAGNELADGQTEPGRRSRLAAFVSATATHLEAQRAAAEKEFGVIQDFSGQIENVLSHHEELSRGSIVPEAVSLQDIFESARRLIETTSRLPIRVLIASETSHLPHVLAQRVVLRQIMENLVVNAIESIEEQKPETGILALAATSLPDKVEIAITDNGVGIPAEAINSIFSRGVSTKGQSGRGLGLHYSATSVRAMNGNISAESAGPGQGATFRISLPLSADTELVA